MCSLLLVNYFGDYVVVRGLFVFSVSVNYPVIRSWYL